MAAPSSVRFLAPIALVATLLALVVVLASSGGNGSSEGDRGAGSATTTQAPPDRRSYVVRRGDTLVSIAERFGVAQERLMALNPDIDAQALQPGTRIKLRR